MLQKSNILKINQNIVIKIVIVVQEWNLKNVV